LLAQDYQVLGGLQVQRVGGTRIHITPVENSIVMNIGDMLMRWSNGIIMANLHQVVAPPTNINGSDFLAERYSIAFFCNANKETLLECLEPCCQSEAAQVPSDKCSRLYYQETFSYNPELKTYYVSRILLLFEFW
jgi:isopenicillin N synthase-like dioxygenase